MPGAEVCRTVLPGIIQRYPNNCRDELLKPLWKQLIACLGLDGPPIITTLFMDCGLFVRLDLGTVNFRQLCGSPIHDLVSEDNTVKGSVVSDNGFARKASEVKFARHRVLYGRASHNHKGEVHFGFRNIHILNRLSRIESPAESIDLMRYMFPRQFRLHNVFTSAVDKKETAQEFKDYTTRDDEFACIPSQHRARLPRRLRGKAHLVVEKLRKLHQRCSYAQMLYHFCPVPRTVRATPSLRDTKQWHPSPGNSEYHTQLLSSLSTLDFTEPSTLSSDCAESSFLPYTVSMDRVSAFCRSIFIKLLPSNLFGTDDEGRENWRSILSHIDRFVYMRKFETLSLHEVCSGLKLKAVEWLVPANITKSQNMSASDMRKREEILQELVYYLFDSLLIPLLNSNFYITESGIHRNRLLYFRHDIWERLCQPTLASSRLGALIPLTKTQLGRAKHFNDLGYNAVRFLPKDVGTRSILNLRRRVTEIKDGKCSLGLSTNGRLAPVFDIFNYERRNDRGVFQSDSFSLQTLGERLSEFKAQIPQLPQNPLYFVKVDIQSAFDSIPQEKLLCIVNQIFKHDQYYNTYHTEGKYRRIAQGPFKRHSVFRFVKSAHPVRSPRVEGNLPASMVANKRNIIFSDIDRHRDITADQARNLLRQHVQCNVVKLGRDFYQKTKGIAQGSILSSLLCTFFYNDFEMKTLGFLDTRRSIILRIMDDFLLITLDKADALRFMLAMKAGNTSYGIRVHPEKSLVNFDITVDDVQVPKLAAASLFPFCGLFIDTSTLQVSKNRVRKDNTIVNSLTVDLHGQVGAKFKRRILSSLRIQLQKVMLSRGLNDKTRVARTVVESIQETAMKMHQYYNNLPTAKRPSSRFLIDTIQQIMNLSTRMVLESRQGFDHLARSQVQCLVAAGMIKVLTMRRSHYTLVLAWLQKVKTDLVHSLDMGQQSLDRFVDCCFESVQHYRF